MYKVLKTLFLFLPGLGVATICPGIPQTHAQTPLGRLQLSAERKLLYADTGKVNTLLDKATQLGNHQPDSALKLLQDAFSISIQLGFEEGIRKTFPSIAEAQDQKGQYKETRMMLQGLLSLCHQSGFHKLPPHIYNSLGVSFQKQGGYDSASFYYDRAVSAAPAARDTLLMVRLYLNYSSLLIVMERFDAALDYLVKAEKILAIKPGAYLQTQVFLNRGGIYNKLEQWQKARENLQKALALARRNTLRQSEFVALTSLGNNYYLQQDDDKAITLLMEALRIEAEVDPFYKTMAIKTLGYVYRSKNNLPRAIHYLDMALEYARSQNIPQGVMECSRALSRIYTAKGEYKKALAYQTYYIQLKDSLENINIKENINELEIRYQAAEKDKKLAEKQLLISQKDVSLRQKNNWITGISLGALLLTVLGTLAFTLYRVSQGKRRLQEQTIKTLAQEQEIRNLKSIMQGEEKERKRIAQELHDGIGGMLSSLRMNLGLLQQEYPGIIASGTLQRISEQLTATAGEVRHTAHNLMPDILLRHDLKAALLHFCANLDQDKLKIDIRYHVQEPLKKEIEIFLYRMIQELTQNVVKHAAASHAVIQIMQAGTGLNLTVEDNGRGFDTTLLYDGMGLQNIRQRVENTGGTLEVNSKPGSGTIIQLSFIYEQLLKL